MCYDNNESANYGKLKVKNKVKGKWRELRKSEVERESEDTTREVDDCTDFPCCRSYWIKECSRIYHPFYLDRKQYHPFMSNPTHGVMAERL